MSPTSIPESPAPPDWLLFRFAAGRVLVLFLFHAIVFAVAYVFAWLVRFEFEIPPEFGAVMESSLPYVVGLQLTVAAFFGFYRGWWRYVGITDVIRLVVGMSTALVLLVMAWYAAEPFELDVRLVQPPRGVLLIDWAFALLTLFGTRVAIRVGRDRTRPQAVLGGRKVLIVGAGDAGETLAREIEHRHQLGMKVIAFVDDNKGKWGSQIRGIPVRGPIADVKSIVDATGAEEALIAIPSASGRRMREIVHALAEADLSFKTIPGIDHLVTGRVHVAQLRPVNVEDLIRREKIELPGDPVRELFRGKRVVVTGAGGTIGSELAAQILALEPEALHLVERSEFALYQVDKRLHTERGWMTGVVHRHLLDIRDDQAVARLLGTAHAHIVIHAAAHKHVPLGEENAAEYIANNTLCTLRLAEECDRNGVERFVFVSTDKAINPSSIMGASKRAAEILLMDLGLTSRMKITAVRFGNVLGSSGSVVPLFIEQIASGGPVTVTHPDVARYFLRTSEAISLVLQAVSLGHERHGCVMMLEMGEPIRIADLARHLLELSGRDDVEISFTGLRPGEKLFEEVRLDGESNEPTQHPQIVITKAPQPDSDQVRRWLESVDGVLNTQPRVLLARLVPEFAAYPRPVPSRDSADYRAVVLDDSAQNA